MKRLSIKLRVTLWFTLMMVLLVAAVLTFLIAAGGHIELLGARNTLTRTVAESFDELEWDDGKLDAADFDSYSRGVYLAVYSADGNRIYGRLPKGFDDSLALSGAGIRSEAGENGDWLVYDEFGSISKHTRVWVRGAMPATEGGAFATMIRLAVVALPAIVLLSALIGYLLVAHAFRPIARITASAEQIAERIKNIYKISEITIVPDGENDGITNTKVAEVAFNQYFSRANDGKRVGIGWGVMVGKMADYASTLENAPRTNGAIFPLAGGVNSMTRDYHLNELVRIFSLKTGRDPYLLYAPALHDTPTEFELAKHTEAYISIKEEWEYMEQALVSISNFPSYPDLAVKSLYGNALTEKKAVGWMLAHYFDSYGRIISPAAEATLQASVKQLKTTDLTAVCSNQIKPQCVIGALRTGIIDRLILPLSLAEKVSNTFV